MKDQQENNHEQGYWTFPSFHRFVSFYDFFLKEMLHKPVPLLPFGLLSFLGDIRGSVIRVSEFMIVQPGDLFGLFLGNMPGMGENGYKNRTEIFHLFFDHASIIFVLLRWFREKADHWQLFFRQLRPVLLGSRRPIVRVENLVCMGDVMIIPPN
jgi:hypothetical protein